MRAKIVLASILLCASGVASSKSGTVPPQLPLHFEADLEIKSHLIDAKVKYPPSLRKMKIRYDFTQGLARADILAGYDNGKSYIRRYDTKKEYKVKYGQYKSCERAYLGEDMPVPEFPKDLLYQRNERILGQDCEVWTHNIPQSDLRIHVYESKAFNVPIRLIQESRDEEGNWVKQITYDFLNMKVQPQDLNSFDIPGYSHETCTRNVMGFPYIHAFDYYLRF
ncbi:hypothetical protein AC1031_002868 [Aphanomyces cochlioides]|nr:hypothetical protein AC1031_002868 [Aphanomyces cochlioides]